MSVREEIEQYKRDGDRLVAAGELSMKERNDMVRQKAIKLGIIDKNEFPTKISPIIEGTAEVIAGVGSFLLGTALTRNPYAGQAIAGAATGATSRAIDELGDMIYPDIPSPTNREQTKDAVFEGALVSAFGVALQGASPLIGKAVKPVKDKIGRGLAKGKDKIKQRIQKTADDLDEPVQTLGGKIVGLSPEASSAGKTYQNFISKQLREMGKEPKGIPMGLAAQGGIVRTLTNTFGPVPIGGKPIQVAAANLRDEATDVARYTFSPKEELNEYQASQQIALYGKQFFENEDKRINAIYKSADKIMQDTKYEYDANILKKAIEEELPAVYESGKKTFRGLPPQKELNDTFGKYLNRQLDDINKSPNKNYTFQEVEDIMFQLKQFSRTLNPYNPNSTADASLVPSYGISRNIQNVIEKSYFGKDSKYAADIDFKNAIDLREKANDEFATFMQTLTGYESGLISQAIGKGLRSTVGKENVFAKNSKLSNLYNQAFGKQNDIDALDDLRTIMGDERFKALGDMYIDQIFHKHLYENVGGKTILKVGFDAKNVLKELGFLDSNRSKSLKYLKTKKILELTDDVTPDDLEGFINLLAITPDPSNMNTFVTRSLFLRFASGVNPMAVVGALGVAGAAGGLTAAVGGVGVIYGLSYILAQPSIKPLLAQAAKKTKKGEQYRKILTTRINQILERLNKRFETQIPPSALTPVATVPTAQAITDNQE
jgi:hypothetical protein